MAVLIEHAYLYYSIFTSITPGNDVINPKHLSDKTVSPQSYYFQFLIFRIETKRCVKKFLWIKSTLLHQMEHTLVNRVGSNCLYLWAASLLLKMSSKLDAQSYQMYSWKLQIGRAAGNEQQQRSSLRCYKDPLVSFQFYV